MDISLPCGVKLSGQLTGKLSGQSFLWGRHPGCCGGMRGRSKSLVAMERGLSLQPRGHAVGQPWFQSVGPWAQHQGAGVSLYSQQAGRLFLG